MVSSIDISFIPLFGQWSDVLRFISFVMGIGPNMYVT